MKILYAEDERQLSIAVAEILKIHSYEVDAVYDGEQAWNHLQSSYYDAAVLDIMMPKMDGIQVMKAMRQNKIYVPVLMLTAKSTLEDRVEGLAMGADDYLVKPFAMKELLARLDAVIRRSAEYKDSVLNCGNISLNCETDELRSDSGSLRLSCKERELLALFIKRENFAFEPQEINKIIWNKEQSEKTVKLYISYLKNKLNQIHANVNVNQNQKGYFIGRVDHHEET